MQATQKYFVSIKISGFWYCNAENGMLKEIIKKHCLIKIL